MHTDCPGHAGELVLEWTPSSDLRHRLEWVGSISREDGEWNRYELHSIGHPPLQGNLCPVLYRFCEAAPEELSFQLHLPNDVLRELALLTVRAT